MYPGYYIQNSPVADCYYWEDCYYFFKPSLRGCYYWRAATNGETATIGENTGRVSQSRLSNKPLIIFHPVASSLRFATHETDISPQISACPRHAHKNGRLSVVPVHDYRTVFSNNNVSLSFTTNDSAQYICFRATICPLNTAAFKNPRETTAPSSSSKVHLNFVHKLYHFGKPHHNDS